MGSLLVISLNLTQGASLLALEFSHIVSALKAGMTDDRKRSQPAIFLQIFEMFTLGGLPHSAMIRNICRKTILQSLGRVWFGSQEGILARLIICHTPTAVPTRV